MIYFEWNDLKNIQNVAKHKISFIDAASAFYDDYAIIIKDESHSQKEERFLLLGLSINKGILVVCHCYKYDEETIRIISARKATRKEEIQYLVKKGKA